ncbi:hypothetical protein FQB35_06790 [Crassaminicella thermophila]|uniref:PRC-barrel domain-containing protein n=1 Tax=Crassaminicella thermophila TaxID=2599308 RepID=A0A5C0SFJ5_CRATE|nr:PRC-barrel domain-containing protein [Crassaminicella thermophila]QEK12104.1 hypothetical protein FQB35_06790 [Crassaminicella thermophila]
MITIQQLLLKISVVYLMIKIGKDIVGLPIICLEKENENIEIKDIICCKKSFRVIAFLVDEGGYFHQPKIIYFKNIKSIGEDAVVIQKQECIKSTKEYIGKFYLRKKLLGLKVITDTGDYVGNVQDILIEILTGKLLGLILTEGLFDDLVEGRPILPLQDSLYINKNSIIIPKSLNTSTLYNTGGLKKLLPLE